MDQFTFGVRDEVLQNTLLVSELAIEQTLSHAIERGRVAVICEVLSRGAGNHSLDAGLK